MGKRKLKWLAAAVITLAVVAVAAGVLLHWMSGSNEGTVQVGTPAAVSSAPAGPVTVRTSYFTTVLPAGFSVKRQTENASADPQLEVEANTPSATDLQVALSAGPLPAAGLQALGDYNLRATTPAAYQPFSPPGLPAGAAAYRNVSGPAAYTVFWAHSGRYFEISLSSGGTGPLDALNTVFAQLMSSWQWL